MNGWIVHQAPACCPWHDTTCGVEDYCCNACPDGYTRHMHRAPSIGRPQTPTEPKEQP